MDSAGMEEALSNDYGAIYSAAVGWTELRSPGRRTIGRAGRVFAADQFAADRFDRRGGAGLDPPGRAEPIAHAHRAEDAAMHHRLPNDQRRPRIWMERSDAVRAVPASPADRARP